MNVVNLTGAGREGIKNIFSFPALASKNPNENVPCEYDILHKIWQYFIRSSSKNYQLAFIIEINTGALQQFVRECLISISKS